MNKDNLFNLIRNEEVIIWAGAGLSLYAGYPTGKELNQILFDGLSESEKKMVDGIVNLPDLAEEIFRLKGGNKNYIIKTLSSIFHKIPLSTSVHDLISKIPHFKDIITTNYDNLFENSYKTKASLIINESQIPYISKDKTRIFKVHGDLSNPDSIIITKSDYNNFFKLNTEYNTYWNVIKERISTNCILFLGYNLEDPNVSVVFDRITDNLNFNRKECFLVAPNLPQHKIIDLSRKGISYLDSTAEDLIEELIRELKDNVIDDLENNKITADTLKKFLAGFDLLPILDSTENNYNVKSLKGVNGKVEGKLNLTIKNEKDILDKFKSFATGKEFGEFELDEKVLQNVELSFGGIRLAREDKLVKIKFQSTPKVETNVTFRFENGFQFEDFPVKFYAGNGVLEFHSLLKCADLKMRLNVENLPENNFRFTYKHNSLCSSASTELQFFNFLKNFTSGNEFSIFLDDGNVITKTLPLFQELNDESQFFINYFENLKVIENYYKINFSNINFNEINDDTYDLILNIATIIKDGYLLMHFDDEIIAELIDNYSEDLITTLDEDTLINFPLTANYNKEEIVELHGLQINLGYKKQEFLSPYVTNIEDVKTGTAKTAIIRSKEHKCRLSYSKENSNKEK